MTIKLSVRPSLFFGILFVFFSILIWAFSQQLNNMGVDSTVLLLGNIILYVATLISFVLYRKSLQNNNPQYFLRMIYGGMFTKMLICVGAAVVYILVAKSGVNKFALFGCFGLYFIYTFIEVRLLMQLSKGKKNG